MGQRAQLLQLFDQSSDPAVCCRPYFEAVLRVLVGVTTAQDAGFRVDRATYRPDDLQLGQVHLDQVQPLTELGADGSGPPGHEATSTESLSIRTTAYWNPSRWIDRNCGRPFCPG